MKPRTNGNTLELIETLHRLTDSGVLRRLDLAFAQFIHQLDLQAVHTPQADDSLLRHLPPQAVKSPIDITATPSRPALVAAAALLSRLESLGHTSLPLTTLVFRDDTLYAWPVDSRGDITQLWQLLPDTLAGWLEQIGSSTTVLRPDRDQDLGQPLILVRKDGTARLYLRRYWRDEQTLTNGVQQRCVSVEPIDTSLTHNWLNRLFNAGESAAAATAAAAQTAAPDWQKIACALALRARFTIITGGPGTGKTYTAARLLALLFALSPAPERLRIALAAPTGKAAARLRQSIDTSLQNLQARLGQHLNLTELTRRIGGARTLHALLGSRPDSRRFHHHEGNPLDADVVIIDEASMIHLEMMAALIRALPPQARLVLLGDKDQLASVEAGAVLGDLCRDAQAGHYDEVTVAYVQAASGESIPDWYRAAQTDTPSLLAQQTVMLRESRRFQGPIGALAQAVNAGDAQSVAKLLSATEADGPLWAASGAQITTLCSIAVHGRPGAPAAYRDYLLKLRERPAAQGKDTYDRWACTVLQSFDRFRVLCGLREGSWGVAGINQAIEDALAAQGLVNARGTWYAGRPVMVTRNNPALKVFNGDVGLTLPSPDSDGRLRVYFLEGEQLRSVSVSRLSQVETAYAMTVHKSQGSEFEHTALVLPARGGRLLSRELVYTGITRARSALTLVTETSGVLEASIKTASATESAHFIEPSH